MNFSYMEGQIVWVWNMSVKTPDLSTNGTHSIHWADCTAFHKDNLGNEVCLGFWIKAEDAHA